MLYMETSIGKSRLSDISLPVKSLKGKHAIIFQRGEDLFISACYPSSHEVMVNGNPIHRNDRRLDEGYVVKMEELSFSVHIEEPEDYESQDYNLPEDEEPPFYDAEDAFNWSDDDQYE